MRRWLVVAALILAACGGAEAPKSGKVLDKTFTPAWVETGFIPICVGNPVICTPMPYTTHHPDRWHLFLENCDKQKENGEPLCFKGYREVDSGTYERMLVGDHYAGAAS